MHQLKRGILIVLEGIDGSGKTLLAKNLYKYLEELFEILLTKEPGGSQLGKYLRTILQEKNIPIDAKAEYLLFVADRAQHFKEVIIPALDKHQLIISDRMCDSSVVYQGYGRGLDIAMIQDINTWAMNSIQPDVTFYVRIDAQTARKRLVERGKLSTFDQESDCFFQKLIDGFEQLYKNRADVIILDGTLSPEKLIKQAKEKLLVWINNKNLLK